MQLLRLIAERKKKYIVFVASSVPKLKTTLIKDFQSVIMGDEYNARQYNKQDMIYTFPSGGSIKFMSGDSPGNFTGPRFDYVLLDEINTMRYGEDIFNQIDIRTKGVIFPTFNPSAKFWITDTMARDDCKVIHSTYKDNPYIDNTIVRKLEQRAKTDENFYKVYTLGEWGSLEGLVFKFKTNWDYYTDEPKEYDAEYWGMDFGFSKSWTALVRVRVDYSKSILYLREYLAVRGKTNDELYELIQPIVEDELIICDSNEPKTIVDLRKMGLNTLSAKKGPDSIRSGIQKFKGFLILVHEKSEHLIQNMFNYAYPDGIGKEGDENPVKEHDDFIDAARYAYTKYN
jgi:phage terminase large subunit